MAQSLCKIYLHVIFHIKTTSPQVSKEHLPRLHAYVGQLVNSTGCNVICIGGTENPYMTISHGKVDMQPFPLVSRLLIKQ